MSFRYNGRRKADPFDFASFDKLRTGRAGTASLRGACPEPFGPEDLRTDGRQEQILRRFAPQDDSEGLRMTAKAQGLLAKSDMGLQIP